MRELVLLVSLTLAALLGMTVGFAWSRSPVRRAPQTIVLTDATSVPEPNPMARVTRIVAPIEPANVDLFPTTVARTWRPEDKEALLRRMEKLSKGDADYLCLVLGLILADEVFDKVNVKGRLVHYVNGLSGPSDLSDLEAAFRQLPTR